MTPPPNRFYTLLSVLIVCSSLAACHASRGIPVDTAYASKIKMIATVVAVQKHGFLAEPHGGIGSLLVGQPYSTTNSLDAELEKIDFNLERRISAALKQEFLKKGIESTSAPTTTADATLLIDIFSVQYARDIGATDFKPFAIINTKITDSKTGTIIYKHQFLYDPRNLTSSDVTFIRVDQKHYFGSKEALLSNPKLAAEGLSAFVQPLAEAIAQQLAR